jgi:transposase
MSHANARLTPRGRLILVQRVVGGWTISAAARAAGVSRQTGSKWWGRYRAEGSAGLVDRQGVVRHQARALDAAVVDELCRLRCRLRVGPHRLAWRTGLSRSTIYAVLRRRRLSRLDRLEPRPVVVRYERAAPGELLHLDTKQLGRIRPGGGLPKPQRLAGYGAGRKQTIGWNRVHVAVDDHTRIEQWREDGV